jgi:hypothetical protein
MINEKSGNLRRGLAEMLDERGYEIARAMIDRASAGDLKAFGAICEILGDGTDEVYAVPQDLSGLTFDELRLMRMKLEELMKKDGLNETNGRNDTEIAEERIAADGETSDERGGKHKR